MQIKHTIVAIILVVLNISFNCLKGPNKKNDDASAQILPNVYTMTNLETLVKLPKTNNSKDKREINIPKIKEIQKPHIRYFTGNEGHAVSFVKNFWAPSEPINFSAIF